MYIIHVPSHATSSLRYPPPTHVHQTQVTLRLDEGGSLLVSIHHTEPAKMSLACATQGNVMVSYSYTTLYW